MASIVPFGSNMLDLTNNQRSNLRIAFNIGAEFNCDMCKKTIKDDYILCFCNECKKCLHPECAGVKIGTQDGSKQIVLPAQEQLPKSCHDCLRRRPIGNAVTDLLFYDRQQNSVHTLATTSSITRHLQASNESAHKLTQCANVDGYLIHTIVPGHELVEKDYGTIYSCFGCKEKGFGPHHECHSASCSFCLHEECKSPRASMMHPFFPGLSFAFSSSPAISYCKDCRKEHSTFCCNACGMDVNGYLYASTDGQNHLHPCCVNLPHQITCGITRATMVLQKKSTSKCGYCGERRLQINGKKTDETWSYVSKRENFHLHVQCIVKMLSDLNDESAGQHAGSRLQLITATGETGVMKMNLQIASAGNVEKKWEKKFKTFLKYAKIALGAIIAAFLGDPATFFINLIVAFVS